MVRWGGHDGQPHLGEVTTALESEYEYDNEFDIFLWLIVLGN